jgi:tryptophan-rich sensory protein
MVFHASGPDSPSQYRPLYVFLILTLGVGALASIVTTPSIPDWYARLVKPPFSPPDWLFAPVWTALYILMAVAGWRAWRITGTYSIEMAVFGLQLAFNGLWSFIFFAAHQIGSALLELAILWLLILSTAILFWRRNAAAGILLLPYLAWTGFAVALNLAIWALNR